MDEKGRWIEKSELKAFSDNVKELEVRPSSFDGTIQLRETVPAEVFLDHEWESVYQLSNVDLAEAIGNDIYVFAFSYRGGTTCNNGFLLRTDAGLFLFSGSKIEYSMLTLSQEATIDDYDDSEEDIDEFDFSMM